MCCVPSLPKSLTVMGTAIDLGKQPVRAAIKAGEALLDQVHDFDGDQSTLKDARPHLQKFENAVKTVARMDLQDRLLVAAAATVLAPLGAAFAPAVHIKFD